MVYFIIYLYKKCSVPVTYIYFNIFTLRVGGVISRQSKKSLATTNISKIHTIRVCVWILLYFLFKNELLTNH